MMKAYSKDHAWKLAFDLLDAEVDLDKEASDRAGYPLYIAEEGYAQVADLGERLEVTDSKSNTVNVWIVTEENPVVAPKETFEEGNSEQYINARSDFFAKHSCFKRVVQTGTEGIMVTEIASNGRDWLCEQYVYEGRMDYWSSEDQTRRSLNHKHGQHSYHHKVSFLRNEGYRFKGREELETAWLRREKLNRGQILTWEEFQDEAQIDATDDEDIKKLYDHIVDLIEGSKLHTKGMLNFTGGACKEASKNLDLIQTVELNRGNFRTNTCLQIVSEEEAKVRVNEEFGFEVGALTILGTPCYDVHDYNFIRFESRGWRWVMIDGEIYREYA